LYLAIGHILLYFIVDLLRGAGPRWQLGWSLLDSILILTVVGVLEVLDWFWRDLRLV
jgi:hypothetical protein